MASRSIPVSHELYQKLARLAKGIRAEGKGLAQFTTPETLGEAFIAYGLDQATTEFYERQARHSDPDSMGPVDENEAAA